MTRDLVGFCDVLLRNSEKPKVPRAVQYVKLEDAYNGFNSEHASEPIESLLKFRSEILAASFELERLSIKYKSPSSVVSSDDFLYRLDSWSPSICTDSLDLKRRLLDAQKELDLVQEATRDLDVEKVLQSHIKALHDYNEMKDAGQVLVGQWAQLQGMTVKEVYADFGLTEED